RVVGETASRVDEEEPHPADVASAEEIFGPKPTLEQPDRLYLVIGATRRQMLNDEERVLFDFVAQRIRNLPQADGNATLRALRTLTVLFEHVAGLVDAARRERDAVALL